MIGSDRPALEIEVTPEMVLAVEDGVKKWLAEAWGGEPYDFTDLASDLVRLIRAHAAL